MHTKNIESSMAMPLNNVSKVDTKEEPEIYQENITETNKVVPFFFASYTNKNGNCITKSSQNGFTATRLAK